MTETRELCRDRFPALYAFTAFKDGAEIKHAIALHYPRLHRCLTHQSSRIYCFHTHTVCGEPEELQTLEVPDNPRVCLALAVRNGSASMLLDTDVQLIHLNIKRIQWSQASLQY